MGQPFEFEVAVGDAAKRFAEAVASVDPDDFVTKPATGGWSVAEVVEHVAIVNGGIRTLLDGRLEPMTGPPDLIDEEMPYLFYGGEEPPNVAAPTGTWFDLDAACERFHASVDGVLEWARTSSVDLRAVGSRHAVFGMLSAAQWLRFVEVHTWRHRTQVLAVRRTLRR